MTRSCGILLCMAAALAMFPSCTDFGEAPETSLSFQQARWKSFNIDSYTMVQGRGCFCPGPFAVSMLVVRDTIRQVMDLRDSSLVPVNEWYMWYTVDGLFDWAWRIKSTNPHQFTARFDPQYGYPTSIFVDQSQNAVDDEFGYTITGLAPYIVP